MNKNMNQNINNTQASPYVLPNSTSTESINNAYQNMSPMTIPVNTYHTPTQHPANNNDYQEEEEYFTPLISPAIPPNYYTNLRCDTNFSPLTSPALGPQHQVSMSHHSLQVKTDYSTLTTNIQEGQSPEELQERLAMIERQQQQLLSGMGSPTTTATTTNTTTPSSSSPSINSNNNNNNKASSFGNNNNLTIGKSKQSLRHKIAMSSPQFNATVYSRSPGLYPVKNNNNNNHPHSTSSINNQILAPATPSLLMKLGSGTHNNTIGTNSNDHSLHNSPLLNPSISSSSQDSNAVDNIMVLPDAILPPSSSSSSNNNSHENHHHHHHRKTSNSSSVTSPSSFKRRRISHPRSAFTPPALLPSSPQSFRHSGSGIDHGIAALVSPAALRPHHHHQHHPSLPSPSSSSSSSSSSSNVLVQNMITSSPRALKPLISPSLQPNGKRLSTIDEQEAANILATKSNYQALREGKAKSLGIEFNTNIQSGMENRRSAHKAAEQRRRDTLKQSFDSLRAELLEALVAEDELICILDNHPSTTTSSNNKKQQQQEIDDSNNSPPIQKSKEEIILERQKKIKQMSKVVLLQHSYEYMLRLKLENKRKDDKMAKMTQEIQSLRSKLGMELITEEERQADIEEKRQENEKRIERLKRLEDITDS
ncbi:unnamed protein product [Cunninghamella echinulata]